MDIDIIEHGPIEIVVDNDAPIRIDDNKVDAFLTREAIYVLEDYKLYKPGAIDRAIRIYLYALNNAGDDKTRLRKIRKDICQFVETLKVNIADPIVEIKLSPDESQYLEVCRHKMKHQLLDLL
jgi:hypothetical protein